jgi:NAD(P)-dependent dehydrogenase (short-subunit alcohol dehydrogenase family)
MPQAVCAVIGVGPGNGAALARAFAEDHQVALVARSAAFIDSLAGALPGARAFACDVSDAQAIGRTFGRVRSEMGEVETLVYNAGSGSWGTVEEITLEQFELAWRVNAWGALAAAREVVPAMKERGRGNIIFIGATASRRGGAKTAAFAAAKAAQRSLAESMARHLWPAGIHVALIVVDGIVDLPRSRVRLPDKPDSFFVKPQDVAATARWLAGQAASAWSFEVEARPFGETW